MGYIFMFYLVHQLCVFGLIDGMKGRDKHKLVSLVVGTLKL